MLVLVSPTKTQKPFPGESISDSLFNEQTETILSTLQSYSYEDLKTKMKISDKIATALHLNLNQFNETNIAINTYQGASFKPLQNETWDQQYAQEHFGILSALYGLVKPFQTIGLYRLDFLVDFDYSLYDLWKPKITDYLNKQNKTVISLASLEYEKMISKDDLTVDMIRLDFKEEVDGKFVTKSTYAKTARGKAANYIITHQLQNPNEIKEMSFDDYKYNQSLSTEKEYIFTR